MGAEFFDSTFDASGTGESLAGLNEPLNGTDARRRLEDKLEEQRLRRELREFDFD